MTCALSNARRRRLLEPASLPCGCGQPSFLVRCNLCGPGPLFPSTRMPLVRAPLVAAPRRDTRRLETGALFAEPPSSHPAGVQPLRVVHGSEVAFSHQMEYAIFPWHPHATLLPSSPTSQRFRMNLAQIPPDCTSSCASALSGKHTHGSVRILFLEIPPPPPPP